MLKEGTKAPAFELPDQNGKVHKLSDYAGKKVVLYFYPKDDTPGCTKQACNFSKEQQQFLAKGAVILGVSKDSVESHKKFEGKYELTIPLLADTELAAIKAYEVGNEESGKLIRTTYLIDENGVIVKAIKVSNAEANPQEMLEAL